MSLSDVVHELIDVAAGRIPTLTRARADVLHDALDEAETAPEQAASDAELSQEPSGDPAPPVAPDAPGNPAESFPALPQDL
jgi:hypothetical protein